MIALDAAFLIGYLDSNDAHNQAATGALAANAEHTLAISPLNRAEVLVGPARQGRLDEAVATLEVLNIEDVPLPEGAAVRLAELRAATGSKMPDCCVLLLAQHKSAIIATFDERLMTSAASLGLQVLT